jgi:hypothetical protein
MALSKNIDFKGMTVNDAYFRIWKFDGDKNTISFGLEMCANSSSERLNSQTFTCDYDINGENPIKQAYVYLKTLPEFEGVGDV